MKKFYALLLLGLIGALLVACGPQTEEDALTVETKAPNEAVDREVPVDAADPDADPQAPIIPTPPPSPTVAGFVEATTELRDILPAYDDADIIETESGLRYVIVEEGEGEFPQLCDTVDAHYTGYLIDGTQFDSSRDRDATFPFTLGQGQVIPGWDEGFALLKPGAKAILMIPPELGYGTRDGGTIPPNSTLYFDVELVDVISDRPTVIDESTSIELETGVSYATLIEGTEPISDTDVMVLDFKLWDATGCLVSSTDNGQGSIAFDRAGDRMFGAMITSTVDMKLGESRQMIWPAEAMVGTGLQPITYTIEVTATDALTPPPAAPETITDTAYTDGENGVKYVVLTAGEGEPLLELDNLQVQYHVWTIDGELLTSTIYSGERSVAYVYGAGNLPGFDEGLAGANIGELRQVIIPAELAPPDPSGAPQTDLIIQMEVVGKDAPAVAPTE